MKKLLTALALTVAAMTAQAEVKGTKAQATDLKLGVEMTKKASKEENPYLSCIYYRTALLHFQSVEQHMKETVAKVRSMEQKVCKIAGV
jgi:hypothetical protein